MIWSDGGMESKLVCCLIRDERDDQLDPISSYFMSKGIFTSQSSPLSFLNSAPADFFPNTDIVVVDIDAFPEVNSLIDALILFRKRRPRCLVCLVSEYFDDIDIGTERITICDCSVKRSFMSINIDRLLGVMCFNNIIWTERVWGLNIIRDAA